MAARLAELARRDLPEVLADLRHLVELETPSDDKALLDAGLDGIELWLADRLGPAAARLRHSGGEHGDVLELTYPGAAGGAGPTVLLVCHYDTVWPRGTLADWPVRIDGDHFTGPGCFDMKAGLVQGVWALRALRELGIAHPGVRLLLNGDEEIGSPASRPHIERASADVAATLILEPSRDGMLKTRRKGMGLFDVTAHGVESHAGLDPAAGASAVHALAELVPALTALAAPERGTTVNVGVIAGGTARNVVAGRAWCQVDVRVQDPAEMPRVDAGLAALAPSDPRVKVEIDGGWNRPPLNPNPGSERLLALAREAAADLGADLGDVAVGGASDGNLVAALGRPVLDGLGAVGAGPHSRDEHVRISGTPHQIALVAGLLARLAA
ncbi:M20 family metallopeptidase [Marinitenerispora sediminis]|uniref:Peptidase M20 n=1 Tax=Marinitenerispora sediminis TaxID=1931232 RepID=A0A368TAC4_9ACTN|nr:M20 family metallopeptidase [Marinitenerispora sediminis]RCV53404.1 peptidase M20 [Marinitenerispora sediminis]RCV58448.1 peptidase M20 [Marinitenerispora sediminis]RCV61827.1 peptidase M20 [Marinitenerispora sediminis]